MRCGFLCLCSHKGPGGFVQVDDGGWVVWGVGVAVRNCLFGVWRFAVYLMTFLVRASSFVRSAAERPSNQSRFPSSHDILFSKTFKI